MRGTILAAILAGLALLAPQQTLQGQNRKDYYKDINDAMSYFRSNRTTDKSFALATLGLVGAEARKSGDRQLAQYLAKTGSKATVEGMLSTDASIRQAAGGAISTVNPTLAGPVLALVNGQSYEQRLQGMRNLAELGPSAVAAVPALLSFLKSAKPEDKAGVIQSMATVGAKDPQVADLIAVMAVKDSDPNVQKAALATLTTMPGAGSSIPIFVGTLQNEQDPRLRLSAVQGLAAIAKTNPMAIQELQRLASSDPNPAVQQQARTELARLQTQK
jgi:hypothetical protein